MTRLCSLISVIFVSTVIGAPAEFKQATSKQIIPPTTTSSSSTVSTPRTIQTSGPSVTLPVRATVWQHGQTDTRVEWDGLEGRLVRLELFAADTLVAELSSWTDNTGSFQLAGPLISRWGIGSDYQVLVMDNTGEGIWSERFSIVSELLFLYPRDNSVYCLSGALPIAWSGGSGEHFSLSLYQDGLLVENLGSFSSDGLLLNIQDNTSSAPTNRWEYGTGYRFMVTDIAGATAWSGEFSIVPIILDRLQVDPRGIYPGEPLPPVVWSGGESLVRVSLYRDSVMVCEIASWVNNTGSFAPVVTAGADWSPGLYRYRIEDDYSNEAWSESFEIAHGALQHEESSEESFQFGYHEDGMMHVSLQFAMPIGDFMSIANTDFGAEFVYVPDRYYEIGIRYHLLGLAEQAFMTGKGFLNKIGPIAVLRLPIIGNGAILRAGLGYSLAFTSSTFILKSEYDGYQEVLNSELEYIAGVEFPLGNLMQMENVLARFDYRLQGRMSGKTIGFGLGVAL